MKRFPTHIRGDSLYELCFSFALTRALAGDASHVTSSVDSYLSVWLQLYVDLLLGPPRQRPMGASSVVSWPVIHHRHQLSQS